MPMSFSLPLKSIKRKGFYSTAYMYIPDFYFGQRSGKLPKTKTPNYSLAWRQLLLLVFGSNTSRARRQYSLYANSRCRWPEVVGGGGRG